MDGLLRGRCTSPRGREEPLPLALPPKAWRMHGNNGKHHQWHGPHAPPRHGSAPGWRRTAQRLLLAALAIMVVLRLGAHMLAAPEPDLADLMRLYGDGPDTTAHQQAAAAAAAGAGAGAAQPKLIPRIVHQTHGDGAPPPQLLPYLASWHRLNPGWEVRLYDDQVRWAGCLPQRTGCLCWVHRCIEAVRCSPSRSLSSRHALQQQKLHSSQHTAAAS